MYEGGAADGGLAIGIGNNIVNGFCAQAEFAVFAAGAQDGLGVPVVFEADFVAGFGAFAGGVIEDEFAHEGGAVVALGENFWGVSNGRLRYLGA